MPTIEQVGRYVAGTFGYPIEAELSPQVTGIFNDVTGITMELYRPDGSSYANRVLPLPETILDVNGKLRFVTLQTDLTIDGVYTVYFRVAKNGSELVFGGDFTVTEQ